MWLDALTATEEKQLNNSIGQNSFQDTRSYILKEVKLLIFTYAPTGLGHLRVTDALVDSRPKNIPFVLVDENDSFVTWAHRFTSNNPFGKFIFLRSQYGVFEELFVKAYVHFLTTHTKTLFEQMKHIIAHGNEVDEIWIVTTHFGTAHQIGAIKEKLMMVTGKKIRLVVQVTDDTYQHIWCVRGADLTFLPSKFVKEKFESYTKRQGIEFNGQVLPYPLSPLLTAILPTSRGKRSDVFTNNGDTVRVAVPISGAAVGVPYLIQLIMKLRELSSRFEFWVLIKKNVYTKLYISILSKIAGVIVVVAKTDTEMVDLYELMYKQNMIHLEVTKPSEQAFKAIISPRRVGGSVLLFTAPVGRQEIDNLDFLARHELVQRQRKGQETMSLDSVPDSLRSIILAKDPTSAARFIFWATESGLFAKMTDINFSFSKHSLSSHEIGPDGTRLFWEKLAEKFGK